MRKMIGRIAGPDSPPVTLPSSGRRVSPVYRHHLLLLEERGGKLAKLHGAVGMPELRGHYDARTLCGFLARATGLAEADAVTPAELLPEFSWDRVSDIDRVVRWNGGRLQIC